MRGQKACAAASTRLTPTLTPTPTPTPTPTLTRFHATRVTVEVAGDAAIVASLGHPTYDAESVPTAKPPLDCVAIKQRFMAAIGNAEC
jgi:hypothetical protein